MSISSFCFGDIVLPSSWYIFCVPSVWFDGCIVGHIDYEFLLCKVGRCMLFLFVDLSLEVVGFVDLRLKVGGGRLCLKVGGGMLCLEVEVGVLVDRDSVPRPQIRLT